MWHHHKVYEARLWEAELGRQVEVRSQGPRILGEETELFHTTALGSISGVLSGGQRRLGCAVACSWMWEGEWMERATCGA